MRKCSTSKIRRTVRIVLLNNKSEILLMKVVLPDRTIWCTLGGGIEEDESIEQAAKRELFEETGLRDESVLFGPLIWSGEHMLRHEGTLKLHQESFLLLRTSEQKITTNNMTEEEKSVVKELKWWSLQELKNSSEFIVPPVLVEKLSELLVHGAPSSIETIFLGDP
ncbi:NUDIX hydrolase [Salinicola sp. NYA28a]